MSAPEEPPKPDKETPHPQFGDTIGYIENVEPLDAPGDADMKDPYLWDEGEVIGRYTVRKLIARGGMSYVYQADETETGTRVAIKVLPPSPLWTERAIKRFERETEILARIRHPNVVKFIEGGIRHGARYYVMEYIPGDTLEEMTKSRKRISPVESAKIVRALARVLDSIHEYGVIHRDIKPSNVIITPQGVPKIADFGIARILEDESLTLTSEIVGTPFYMSPEQIQGKKELVDRRTDVFSLGVILYELLTGELPFGGDNLATVTYNVVHHPVPPPSASSPWTIQKDLDVVALRALEKDPANRYATAGALSQDLEKYLAGLGVSNTIMEQARRAGRTVKSHAGKVGVGFGLLVALVVGMIVLFEDILSPPPVQVTTNGKTLAEQRAEQKRKAKEAAATGHLDRAREAFQKKDWWTARTEVEPLKNYNLTDAYLANQTEIARMQEVCAKEIAGADRFIKVRRETLRSATAEGQWVEVQRLLETMIEGAQGPYRKQLRTWEAQLTDCRKEIAAEEQITSIRTLRAGRKWAQAASTLRTFEAQYGGTRTAAKSGDLFEEIHERAPLEAAAQSAIDQARQFDADGRWADLAAVLAELEAGTDAYASAEEDLRRWGEDSRREPPAEADFEVIETLYAGKKWDDLQVRIREFEKGHRGTRKSEKVRDRLALYMTDALEGKGASADAEARAIWRTANKPRRDPAEALSEIERLLQEPYKSTAFVRGNLAEIQDERVRIRAAIRKEEGKGVLKSLQEEARRKRDWNKVLRLARDVQRNYLDGLSGMQKRQVSGYVNDAITELYRLDADEGDGEKNWKKIDAGNEAGTYGYKGIRDAGGILKKCMEFHAVQGTSTFRRPVQEIPPEARHIVFHLGAPTDAANVTFFVAVKGGTDLSTLIRLKAGPMQEMSIGLDKLLSDNIATGPGGLSAKDGSLQAAIEAIGFRIRNGAEILVDKIEFRVVAPK